MVRRALLIALPIAVPIAVPIALSLVGIAACSSNRVKGPPFAVPAHATTTTDVELTTATTTFESTSSISPTTSTTTTTVPIPTTTTLPLVTAGGVIRVANATKVEDAAQELSAQFAVLGFTVAEPTNSAGKDEELTVSKIYVKPGGEAVAESVSYLMGGIEVFRMPTPAWIFGGTAALGDTSVLVMLGSDLAGSPLLAMRFEPGRQGPD